MQFLVALIFAALLTFSSAAQAVPTDSFQSDGKTIAIEWFRTLPRPLDRPRGPLVIILHGSGGLDQSGGFFRDMATDFARRGRTAMIVHYFDQTGTKIASPEEMSKNFTTWMATIDQAITHGAKQPFVDPDNVSLLGHSLGAQLALHMAAKDCPGENLPSIPHKVRAIKPTPHKITVAPLPKPPPPKYNRVSAVVDMAGCFVFPIVGVLHMPPVLILHGEVDKVVPIGSEHALVADLKRIGVNYEEHIFPDGDHAFKNVPFDDLMNLSETFLAKNRNRKLHLPTD